MATAGDGAPSHPKAPRVHWPRRKGPVNTVAWSPDATTLATASADQTVRLWNPTTGTELLAVVAHAFGLTFLTPDEGVACDSPDDGLWWVEGWGRFTTADIPERRITVADALAPVRALLGSSKAPIAPPAPTPRRKARARGDVKTGAAPRRKNPT